MNKIIKTFSIIIICLFALSAFGWMSVQLSKGEKDFGILSEPIEFMYSFFDTLEESVEEVNKLPDTFIPTAKDFEPINKLKEDIKVLFTYSETIYTRAVAIKNLKTDEVLWKYSLPDSINDYDRVLNPLLMPNQDLIYAVNLRTGLRRLDKDGNVLWKQDSMRIHHAFNVDSVGNIWACASPNPYYATGKYMLEGKTVYFIDDYISKINSETGEVMFHKSMAQILTENNLSAYLLRSPNGEDPIHLNDVQPALKTTKYYNEGDLFLSTKSLSLIFHYRPSTNKILRVISGPFGAQHDVDFYNDSTLTFFNNNYYPFGWYILKHTTPAPKNTNQQVDAGEFVTNIMRYDLSTNELSVVDEAVYRENNFFSMTEGLHEWINDSTYFVEQQNIGYIWVIQNGEVIYKNVFQSQHEGHHHLPNWTRIIKDK